MFFLYSTNRYIRTFHTRDAALEFVVENNLLDDYEILDQSDMVTT